MRHRVQVPGPSLADTPDIPATGPLRVAKRAAVQDRWLLRLTRWSLAASAAAMPLYVVRWHYGPVPTTLLESLVLLTVVLYASNVVAHGGPLPGRTPLDVPIAVFLLAGAIGALVAPDHRGALGIFRAYLVEPVAIYYVAVAVLSVPSAIEAFLGTWAAGAAAFALIDLAYFGRALLAHTLRPGHAAAAFYIDPNSVALYLEPLIALAAGFAIFDRGRRRWIAAALLGLLLAAEIATLSRGGLLAMAALGIVAILSLRSTPLRVGVIAAAAGAELAVLNAPVLGPRIVQALDPRYGTFNIRTQIWTVTLRMLRDHPVFGAGLNAYQATMKPYRAGHVYLVPEPYPHDVFLTSWTELGLLGLFAFTFILVVLILLPWRALKRAGWLYRPLLWGAGAAFVAVLVHGLVDSPYWKNDLSLEFWIVAALEIAAVRAVASATRRPKVC